MNDTIVIPVSKKKLILAIAGCIVFVLLGIFMLVTDISSARYSPLLIKIIAIAGLVFFGGGAIFLIKRLFSSKSGLTISTEGIQDSLYELGLIKWEDISNVEIIDIMSNKIMLIHLHDPQKFVNRPQSKFKRKMMLYNINNYGTPVSISSHTLKCNFNDLNKLITEYLEKYK
ncbi:STM3941 family protein [Abyssalbus ytuae]|uniref:Uncharacterized protein n=1 Tax=Abyssalbus ytuae TaxID=2926907 RepID=A0A9E6ZNI5_9FLAO|nr:STM3941 family protein [Abyssalbus ytuae]UOB19199.1 hypothetical protein MQE35_07840 [Abyssalbus ytuae]